MKCLYSLLFIPLLTVGLDVTAEETTSPVNDHRTVYFNLGMELAVGGDDIMKVEYDDGSSGKVKAGSGVGFDIGIYVQPKNSPVHVALNYGFLNDNESAENGEIEFKRKVIDLFVYYNFNSNHQLGFGLIQHSDAKFSYNISDSFKINYDDASGMGIEYNYLFSERMTMGIKYVDISYQPEHEFITDGTNYYQLNELDGSHFALGLNFRL